MSSGAKADQKDAKAQGDDVTDGPELEVPDPDDKHIAEDGVEKIPQYVHGGRR